MAKGLTGAYAPLAATTVSPEVAEHFEDAMLCHGHTYAGHPVSCAAGLAAIRTYQDEELIERAREMESYLTESLGVLAENHPSVGETRGVGMFHGVELTPEEGKRVPFGTRADQMADRNTVLDQVADYAADNGVALYTSYNAIVVAPPLVITRSEIDRAVAVIDEALAMADEAMD